MPVINSVCAWEVLAVESKLFNQITANSLAIQRGVKCLTHWLLSLMRREHCLRGEVAPAATKAKIPRKVMIPLKVLPEKY
jgi:hypothetical protein